MSELDEIIRKTADAVEPKTHCCECEHSIQHHVCVQYPNCNASSAENCNYRWTGKRRIVGWISDDLSEARVKDMTYQEYLKWAETHPPIRFRDLGLNI